MHLLPPPARWHQNGKPREFAFCNLPFERPGRENTCLHIGLYYCDEVCYADSQNTGLARIENIARLQ
jgi:hypothetical protein